LNAPSARTRVAAVIGSPIRHSLSPLLHNTAFASLGLDWVYVAFEVAPGRAADALGAMRAFGLGGMSVTMPHKTDAARACDALTPDAAALRSVNCVVPQADGGLLGDSTDGPGFVRSLADAGVDTAGARVLLLGAGGAARAVALALARAGATVGVAARREEAAADVARLHEAISTVEWGSRDAAAARATIVVNATPVGMGDDRGLPLDAAALHHGQVVADLITAPLETPLLRAAGRAGATVVDGLGMLVHQAALAFVQWTGLDAPVAVMAAAARAAISPHSADS
jgi:shikimate dehydrogenase